MGNGAVLVDILILLRYFSKEVLVFLEIFSFL